MGLIEFNGEILAAINTDDIAIISKSINMGIEYTTIVTKAGYEATYSVPIKEVLGQLKLI